LTETGRLPERGTAERPPTPNSPAEADMVDRLTRAWEAADVDSVIALLAEDVWLRMPPMPLEYQGRDLAGGQIASLTRFDSAVLARFGLPRSLPDTGGRRRRRI
jgi:hypothetical protein